MSRLIAVLLASLTFMFASPVMAQSRPDLLEILEVTGEINESVVTQLQGAVDAINDNAKVKGVLLVVDSPGGGVLATANAYYVLSQLKVPVIGWCRGICASGGMYLLMAPSVKFIAVSRVAISGSVGVVMENTRFNRLLDKIMIDNEVFKSGEFKTAGASTQPMSDAERKYLQSIVSDFAEAFYTVVKQARPEITDWNAIKSARIFIGGQAVRLGLVDAVMNKQEAVEKAKKMSKAERIFTREELKKMSRVADERSIYSAPEFPVKITADFSWLIEALKELRSGETIRFSYKLQMKF